MLSLLGSLLGFGGSVIPGILDSFKKKQDQKYELKKLEVQAQINRENLEHQAKIQKEMGKQKFELFQAQAKDKEHERLIHYSIVHYRREQTFKKRLTYYGTKIPKQSLQLLSHSGLVLVR